MRIQKAPKPTARTKSGAASWTGLPQRRSSSSNHDDDSEPDSSTIDHDHAELPDVVEDTRINIEQHIVCASRLVELQGRKFLLAKEMRELDQTQRNYWLTALAAGFAPISLATGFLSMQTRITHIGAVAYDFLGLTFIIVSLMFFMKPFIRYFLVKRPFEKQRSISWDLVSYTIENDSTMPTGYDPWLREKNKTKKVIQRVIDIMLTKFLLYLGCAATLASFLAGWITGSVRTGFLAMAYGLAGSVGFWLLIVSPHLLYSMLVRMEAKHRLARLDGKKRSNSVADVEIAEEVDKRRFKSDESQDKGKKSLRDRTLSKEETKSTEPTPGAFSEVFGRRSASNQSLQRNWTTVSAPSQEWDVERAAVTSNGK
jgi:hypothetical protein